MILGVIGHGRFGGALCDLADEAGLRTLAYDPREEVPPDRRCPDPETVAARADVVVLAIPVLAVDTVLRRIAPRLRASQLVLDVCSVKVEPMAAMRAALPPTIPWAGTHPLFGPDSLARGERPLRVVVCGVPEHASAEARATDLFEALGCRVEPMSAEAHDRSMASTHALTFFLAKGLLDTGADFFADALPPSTRGIGRAIRTVQADAGHLLELLHRRNPFADGARAELLAALGRIDAVLRAENAEAITGGAAAVHIPDLGAASPELLEVRDLIDELDLELVRLLARRGRLARRARQAKSKLGRAVRDPHREDALFAERRDWAQARDLDPDRIEDIFRAVVQFSVALQRDD